MKAKASCQLLEKAMAVWLLCTSSLLGPLDFRRPFFLCIQAKIRIQGVVTAFCIISCCIIRRELLPHVTSILLEYLVGCCQSYVGCCQSYVSVVRLSMHQALNKVLLGVEMAKSVCGVSNDMLQSSSQCLAAWPAMLQDNPFLCCLQEAQSEVVVCCSMRSMLSICM